MGDKGLIPTLQWENAIKGLSGGKTGKAMDWAFENDDLFSYFFPIILESAMLGAKGGLVPLATMGVGVEWGLVNKRVVEWARAYTYELVKNINETTRVFLQESVSQWAASGAPLPELIDTIGTMFDATRAEMIAVTETTRAFAEGNRATWKESGVVSAERWYTVQDDKVCPICRDDLDGVESDLTGQWVGKETGANYGDEFSAPPAHVRCRCYTQPVIKRSED